MHQGRTPLPLRQASHGCGGGKDGRTWKLAVADDTLPSTLGADHDDIEAVDVLMPYRARKHMVVIDTPGISSVNEQVSDKTEELLGMDRATRRGVAQADALVYLMAESIRAEDEEALVGFHASALTAIGVLSRADQIRVDGADPLDAARALTERWADKLRGVVSTVLPVAGLLGETAECHLTNEDVHNLRTLAALASDERDDLLLSKDVLLATSDPAELAARERLHDRLGLYGLGRALEWVDAGLTDAVDLTERLRELSGVSRLRTILDETLAPRADALKANWALTALERLSYASGDERTASDLRRLLAAELEDIRFEPEMHQLRELAAVRACAAGRFRSPRRSSRKCSG